MHFISVPIEANDPWVGKRVADLDMPVGIIITIIKRKDKLLIPRGDIVLKEGDSVLLGTEPYEESETIRLTELVLRGEHPWIGMRVDDLDISRQSMVVLVKRKNKALIPYGRMILQEWDRVFLYTDQYVVDAEEMEV